MKFELKVLKSKIHNQQDPQYRSFMDIDGTKKLNKLASEVQFIQGFFQMPLRELRTVFEGPLYGGCSALSYIQ